MELECDVWRKAESWQEEGDCQGKSVFPGKWGARGASGWFWFGNGDGGEPWGVAPDAALSRVCGQKRGVCHHQASWWEDDGSEPAGRTSLGARRLPWHEAVGWQHPVLPTSQKGGLLLWPVVWSYYWRWSQCLRCSKGGYARRLGVHQIWRCLYVSHLRTFLLAILPFQIWPVQFWGLPDISL